MKFIKSISALLFTAIIATTICLVTGFNFYAIGATLLFISFIPMPKGVALMAIQKEVWTKDIIDNLLLYTYLVALLK